MNFLHGKFGIWICKTVDYHLGVTQGQPFWHQSTDHAQLYRQLIAIFAVSLTISEILPVFYTKRHFFGWLGSAMVRASDL